MPTLAKKLTLYKCLAIAAVVMCFVTKTNHGSMTTNIVFLEIGQILSMLASLVSALGYVPYCCDYLSPLCLVCSRVKVTVFTMYP